MQEMQPLQQERCSLSLLPEARAKNQKSPRQSLWTSCVHLQQAWVQKFPCAAEPNEGRHEGSTWQEDGGDENSEQDSVSVLLNQAGGGFMRGARTVLIIFLAVGFFFLVKYILTWLYYRFLV